MIGTAQESTPEDAEKAIALASASFKNWAAVPGKERGAKLKILQKLLNQHGDDLAKLITAECGKPLSEAKAEVMYSAGISVLNSLIIVKSVIILKATLNGMLRKQRESMEKSK